MKKKWNAVDVGVILFLMIGIGLVFYRMNNYNKPAINTSKGEKMLMMFEIEEVETSVLKEVSVGAVATDHRKQSELGKVHSIELDEAKVYVKDAEGRFHVSPKEGFSSAKISLEVSGKIANDGIRVGSFKYLIGQKVILTLGHSVIFASVTGVESESSEISPVQESSEGRIGIVAFSKSVPNYIVDHINVGDVVMENVGQQVIGRVKSVKRSASMEEDGFSEGKLVSSSKEGYSGLEIVIAADGEVTDRGIVIGKFTYYVGKTMEMSVGQTYLESIRLTGLE